jgi:hypothetical protein
MKLKLFSLVVLFSIGSIAEAQSNPHYMSTDPAIREMMISLDMPRTTGGVSFTSMPSDPAIREMLISMDMPRYAESVPAKIMNGSWQLNLSDERSIKLTLQQSGSAVFGKGIIMNSTISQAAYASGSVSENSLNLEVVPESATELYVISINIRSMPYEGQYVEFLPNSILQTGTITMSTNDFAH